MPETDLVIEVDPAPAVVVVEPPDKNAAARAEPEKKAAPERKVDPPAADPVADLKSQLAALQAERTADSTARQRAEADAIAARAETAQAKVAVVDSNISAVDNAISAAQAEADGFARDQEAALTAGKFAEAAALGRKAARAEARIERLEEGKADLAARKAEQPKNEAPRAKADPFEAAIASSTPRAQKWLREHPTFVTDQSLNRKANIAHLKAIDEGFVLDSDAYFDFCEKELGLKAAPAANGDARQRTPEKRTPAMPGAPVTRDGAPSGGALSPTAVTLTPGEQARATDGTIVWNYTDPKIGAVKGSAIGLKEYARRKLALTAQGSYDRTFTEQ